MCFERLNSDTRGPRVLSPPGEHLFSSFCPELTLQEQPRWIQLSPNGFWAAAVRFTAKWLCTNAPTWCVSGFVSVFTLATQLDLILESLKLVSFCSWRSALLSPTILAVWGDGAKASPTLPSSSFKSNVLCEQLDHHFGVLLLFFIFFSSV